MAFTDECVKAYAGKSAVRNGTLAVADSWQEFNINTILGLDPKTVTLGAFTVWNVTAVADEDPQPTIRMTAESEDQDARSFTITSGRDVKGFTFDPAEYQESVWLKAESGDCLYEYVAEYEEIPK